MRSFVGTCVKVLTAETLPIKFTASREKAAVIFFENSEGFCKNLRLITSTKYFLITEENANEKVFMFLAYGMPDL